MNEHGEIYLGSSENPEANPWYYGQFERAALLTALHILDQAQLLPQNRFDPAIIVRLLSSKICSNPGSQDGIFPSAFDRSKFSVNSNLYTSSSSILMQYLNTGGQTIRADNSGTDWQHAAVLCSLLRAVGIPCRIVTVYHAACRNDGSETNDFHWDVKQRPLKKLNNDFIR